MVHVETALGIAAWHHAPVAVAQQHLSANARRDRRGRARRGVGFEVAEEARVAAGEREGGGRDFELAAGGDLEALRARTAGRDRELIRRLVGGSGRIVAAHREHEVVVGEALALVVDVAVAAVTSR
jgi:hypothetical protein